MVTCVICRLRFAGWCLLFVVVCCVLRIDCRLWLVICSLLCVVVCLNGVCGLLVNV